VAAIAGRASAPVGASTIATPRIVGTVTAATRSRKLK
jgi:hypothetical protein